MTVRSVTERLRAGEVLLMDGGTGSELQRRGVEVLLGSRGVELMGEQAYRQEFAEHARVLAATGVDVMLPEFVNFIADCVAAVDACAEAGRPVWLGVPTVTTDGITKNGETMDDLARALRGHPVQ